MTTRRVAGIVLLCVGGVVAVISVIGMVMSDPYCLNNPICGEWDRVLWEVFGLNIVGLLVSLGLLGHWDWYYGSETPDSPSRLLALVSGGYEGPICRPGGTHRPLPTIDSSRQLKKRQCLRSPPPSPEWCRPMQRPRREAQDGSMTAPDAGAGGTVHLGPMTTGRRSLGASPYLCLAGRSGARWIGYGLPSQR